MDDESLIEPDQIRGAAKALAKAQGHIDAGERIEARIVVEAALARGGDHEHLLSLLGWLRAEEGDRAGAANAFLRLSAITPLNPEHDAFIGFDHFAEGRMALAEPHLRAGLNGRPDNVAYRAALAEVLIRLDRPRDAIGVALPSFRDGLATAGLWRTVIDAAVKLGRVAPLGLLGRRAIRRHPDDPAIAFAVARAFLERGESGPAIDLLSRLPDGDDGETWFLRSVAAAQADRFVEASSAIEKALAVAPATRPRVLHAIGVLGRLGRHGDAAVLLDTVGIIDANETDEAWIRGAFATYTEAGRYSRAIEVGAQLIRLLPDDLEFLSVYETVIGKHLYAELIASKPPPAPTTKRSVRTATSGRIKSPSYARSISALFRREMKTRFGRSRLGYLWVLFEPLAHIGIMILLIGTLNHGGLPPIGQSFAVFYFTGIIPFHIFTHTAGHLIGSVPENRPLLQIPRVRVLDIFAARALLEVVTELIVSAIFLLAFAAIGLDAMPLEPLAVVGALLLLWAAAIGIGMISAAIVSVFPAWERIWGAATSLIYFTSGTFYVPRMMPVWIRDILVWNPVLQGIELVRLHYFHEPAPEWLSVRYLVGFALSALAIALVMEKIMRRRMLEVE